MVNALDGWLELDFVRDEGALEESRPHEPDGWELIVFDLEDEEQQAEIGP